MRTDKGNYVRLRRMQSSGMLSRVALVKNLVGTNVLTRAKRRAHPENGICHSHRQEDLKSYIC
jgi:hypothetical protein